MPFFLDTQTDVDDTIMRMSGISLVEYRTKSDTSETAAL